MITDQDREEMHQIFEEAANKICVLLGTYQAAKAPYIFSLLVADTNNGTADGYPMISHVCCHTNMPTAIIMAYNLLQHVETLPATARPNK